MVDVVETVTSMEQISTASAMRILVLGGWICVKRTNGNDHAVYTVYRKHGLYAHEKISEKSFDDLLSNDLITPFHNSADTDGSICDYYCFNQCPAEN